MPDPTKIDKTLEERIKESLAGLSGKEVYAKVIKQLDDALKESWIGGLMKSIVSGAVGKAPVYGIKAEPGKKTYQEIHSLQTQLLTAFHTLTEEEKGIFKPVLANIKKTIQTLMAATPDIQAGLKGQVEAVFQRPEWKEFTTGLVHFGYHMARLRDLLPELTLGRLPLLEKLPESIAEQLGLKLKEGFHPLTVAITDIQRYYSVVGQKQLRIPELLKTFPAQTKSLAKIKEGIITAARTGQMTLEEFDKLYQVTKLQKTLESDTFELLKVVFPELGDKLAKELEKQTKELGKIKTGLKVVGKPFEGFLYAAAPVFFALKKMGFGKLFGLLKPRRKKKTPEDKRAEALQSVLKKLDVKLPEAGVEALTGVSEEEQTETINRLIEAIKSGEFGRAREAAQDEATRADAEETQEAAVREAKETKKMQKFSFRGMLANLVSHSKSLRKLQDLTGKGTAALKLLVSKGFLLPLLKGALIAALIAAGLFFVLGPGKKMLTAVLKAVLPKSLKFLSKLIPEGISAAIQAPFIPFVAPVRSIIDAIKQFSASFAEGEGIITASGKALAAGLAAFMDTVTFGWVGYDKLKAKYEKDLSALKKFFVTTIPSTVTNTFQAVIDSITSAFGWIGEKLKGIGKFFGIGGAAEISPTGELAPALPAAAPSVVVQPAGQQVSIDLESLRRELAAQNAKLDIIASAASGSKNLQAESLKMKKEELTIQGLRDIYSSGDEPVISVF